jgi:hypothetical protein
MSYFQNKTGSGQQKFVSKKIAARRTPMNAVTSRVISAKKIAEILNEK